MTDSIPIEKSFCFFNRLFYLEKCPAYTFPHNSAMINTKLVGSLKEANYYYDAIYSQDQPV